MYKIYANGSLLSDPIQRFEGNGVTNPEIFLEVNQVNSMSFTVPTANPLYDSLETRTTYIQCYDNAEELFYGRIIEMTRDSMNNLEVYAEGAFAFFCDSIYRPFTFQGSPEALLRLLVENHNSQVDAMRQFMVGNVTVVDPNDLIVRASETPMNTWAAINEKLIDELGGHLRMRLVSGVRYIDYLADYETLVGQSVEYGKNLLNISKLIDASEVVTCLIPYGAAFEEGEDGYEEPPESGSYDGNRLTVKSVNNGVDYIENSVGIARYGRVWGSETWDDVTEPANLLKKANASLAQKIADAQTITATVVDLHLTSPDIPRLKTAYYIPVYSRPHNINQSLVCTKQTLYPDAPDDDKITLGVSYKTLTENQAANKGGS